MKISTLLVPLAASFLRPETTDLLESGARPAPPRRTGPDAAGDARAARARLAELRFPILPPPLS